MINKLKSNAGETITEVLVASLIAVLGVLLFAMMVQSSFRIITTSEEKMKEIYEAESNAEGHVELIGGGPKTLNISPAIAPNKPTSISINVYGTENDEGIYSYKK